MTRIVTHPHFDHAIMLVILFNTGILCLDRYPEPDAAYYERMATLEVACSLAFIGEMAMKLAGLGLFQYCSER
jgi:glyoxylase-like metal-dependent hydrolase (beta-lactamase superfamily II)